MDFSQREIGLLAAAFLIAVALIAGGTIYLGDSFAIANQDDPLATAGGLRPEQAIRVK